ncbi:MAG: hypothetical protein B7Y43_16770 [Sphingomonas sp. 28-62-20]|uniref:hypothetical protein n=1 Tax=Sphingomonas sp. 28-62-20 TaxID=1970433 RepID=UPI000BD8DEC0|nr:MAG: hypothetical protein B7Y43_16770 [Sphingomonas sp. 28-62-20]
MIVTAELASIARDPLWFPHRYDPGHDAVHFLRLARDDHRAATFLIDAELPADADKLVLERGPSVAAGRGGAAPLHFIFHSAYCCSTLLARAMDRPGMAMGLKEPVILNDIVGWRRRGGPPAAVAEMLDGAMTLLAQPFAPGEVVVVKPSNIVNGLARAALAMRPSSHAVLLYAPLRVYLASIAKKGMWGRLWVREFFVAMLQDGMVDMGFDEIAYLGQTDLQIAAIGWLAQHVQFGKLVTTFGPERVRTLNSEKLLERPAAAMTGVADLFGLGVGEADVADIVAGPAFSRHSKFDKPFDAAERRREQRAAEAGHADEIEKVALWAETLAAQRGIALDLGAALA